MLKRLSLLIFVLMVIMGAISTSFSQSIEVDVQVKQRLSGIASTDPVLAYHALVTHATTTQYRTEPIAIPVISNQRGIVPTNWVSLQISSSTQTSGSITDASYEILCSSVIDSGSEVVPSILQRANNADTGVWMPIPAITAYGTYVFPVYGKTFSVRAWTAAIPSNIGRNLDFVFTGR